MSTENFLTKMSDGRAASIPKGLHVALHRGRITPGMEDEAFQWMQMLNDRRDEAVATLDRERMAVELVFRSTEPDGDYLTWISISGAGASVESSEHSLDSDHLVFDRRVRESGWIVGDPQLFLAPAPVLATITSWARIPSP